MNDSDPKQPGSQARRKAQSHFTQSEQRDATLKQELEAERQRNTAKMARLKALRLARDAEVETSEASKAADEPKSDVRQPRKRMRRIPAS